MNSNPTTRENYGDLDALLALFDAQRESVDVASGYGELMSRVTSPDYRRRCGLINH